MRQKTLRKEEKDYDKIEVVMMTRKRFGDKDQSTIGHHTQARRSGICV